MNECPVCKHAFINNGKCFNCGMREIMFKFGLVMAELGLAINEMVPKLIRIMDAIPDEKQIARQRSRDDLNTKRKQMRRGGSQYRGWNV